MGFGDKLCNSGTEFGFTNGGELYLKQGNTIVWIERYHYSRSASLLHMQRDGNMVVYDSYKYPLWSSNNSDEKKQGLRRNSYLKLGTNALRVISPSGDITWEVIF